MIVEGVFFDGKDARGRPASVWRERYELVIEVDQVDVARWLLVEIRYADAPEAGGGRLRLRLGHEGSERLTISGVEGSRFIRSICSRLSRGPVTPKRAWRMVFMWGSAAIISLAFLFTVIIPQIAEGLAHAIPRQTMHQYGQRIVENSAKLFTGLGGGSSEKAICPENATLNVMVKRLTLRQDEEIPLRVWTIRSNIVNALAFPGGHIVIFEGLLDFVENPEELAGILAHEIGHAIERHPTVMAIEGAASAALIGLFFGDMTGGVMLAAVGEAIVNASYSRDMEREADAIGVRMMKQAQIDGSKLADFLTRLAEREGDLAKSLGFLSTHPATEERAKVLPAPMPDPMPAMSTSGWVTVKAMCR